MRINLWPADDVLRVQDTYYDLVAVIGLSRCQALLLLVRIMGLIEANRR